MSKGPLYIPGKFNSKEEVDKYNVRLDSYFAKLELWVFQVHVRKLSSIKININVSNEGVVPAQRVSAWFHFPDGFELVEESDFLKNFSNPPEPPADPNKFSGLAGAFELIRDSPVYLNPRVQSESAPSSISVRKTNSYEVEFNYERIRQGESVEVECLVATFEVNSKSFQIEYRLVCDNCSDIGNGHLSIVFD